jgi:leucyl-tRNA synthetase
MPTETRRAGPIAISPWPRRGRTATALSRPSRHASSLHVASRPRNREAIWPSGLPCSDWPDGTLAAQHRWIGRSEGAAVHFAVADHPDTDIEVFTTRPDTLLGVTYVVLAPEHALVSKITTLPHRDAVRTYVEAAARKIDRDRIAGTTEKTGVPTGAFARHPITGARVPIWVADYVVGGYGTGAVMAVPGHDQRDFVFAKTFDLPIVEVVSPDGALRAPLEAAYVDDGITVQSGEFDGLPTSECKGALGRINARRRAATCLRTECASQVPGQPPLAGGCTHD